MTDREYKKERDAADKGRNAAERAIVEGVVSDHSVGFQQFCENLKERGQTLPPGDIMLVPQNPVFMVEKQDPKHIKWILAGGLRKQ